MESSVRFAVHCTPQERVTTRCGLSVRSSTLDVENYSAGHAFWNSATKASDRAWLERRRIVICSRNRTPGDCIRCLYAAVGTWL